MASSTMIPTAFITDNQGSVYDCRFLLLRCGPGGRNHVDRDGDKGPVECSGRAAIWEHTVLFYMGQLRVTNLV